MPESNTQTNNSPPDFSGDIEINCQSDDEVDERRIRTVVSRILSDAGFREGSISIAVVDDPTIHELNRKYLQHDYPTDVLSFVLDSDPTQARLEGEIIVSSDTARTMAAEYDWEPQSELLLYVIHGTLHLAGMDDGSDELRAAMQEAESRYLNLAGLQRPADQQTRKDQA